MFFLIGLVIISKDMDKLVKSKHIPKSSHTKKLFYTLES